MNELLVIEKHIVNGGVELVKQGYSKKLLNKYLAREAYAVRNAVFILRAALPSDDLTNVPSVNCIVHLAD